MTNTLLHVLRASFDAFCAILRTLFFGKLVTNEVNLTNVDFGNKVKNEFQVSDAFY